MKSFSANGFFNKPVERRCPTTTATSSCQRRSTRSWKPLPFLDTFLSGPKTFDSNQVDPIRWEGFRLFRNNRLIRIWVLRRKRDFRFLFASEGSLRSSGWRSGSGPTCARTRSPVFTKCFFLWKTFLKAKNKYFLPGMFVSR